MPCASGGACRRIAWSPSRRLPASGPSGSGPISPRCGALDIGLGSWSYRSRGGAPTAISLSRRHRRHISPHSLSRPQRMPTARTRGGRLLLSGGGRPDERDSPMIAVGHRGWRARYPANSLAGLTAAAAAGHPVELDAHRSADGVWMVVHDHMTDAGPVTSITAADLDRAGLPRLDVALAALAEHDVACFVEIKRESVRTAGVRVAATEIRAAVAGRDAIPISYDSSLLEMLDNPRGLVIDRTDCAAREVAGRLNPRYIFCRAAGLTDMWVGPWEWACFGGEVAGCDFALVDDFL